VFSERRIISTQGGPSDEIRIRYIGAMEYAGDGALLLVKRKTPPQNEELFGEQII